MSFLRLLAALWLVLASAPAMADWHRATSRHFVIYSDQPADGLKAYAEKLERFDQAVRSARAMKDPPLSEAGKLKVYVLRDPQAVEKILGAEGSGIYGFYIPQASGAVAFVNRARTRDKFELDGQAVFFHEYLHHLMLQDLDSSMPAWLVEGFAEFFATAQIADDGSVVLGHVPEYRSWGLFNLKGLTIEEMLGANDRHIDEDEWELTYGRGWLLTHYLTFEKSRRGQLGRYIQGIRRGETPLASAQAAFGDLKQLNRELDQHLRKKRHSGIVIPATKITVGQIDVRPLGAGEAAALPVQMKLAIGYNKKALGRVLSDARGLAKRHPGEPTVLAALAEAEYETDNFDRALAAADQALALAPNLRPAMIVKGRALVELGRRDRARANWKEARSWLTRANRLDPDDAAPLLYFYQSFGAEGVPATRNAVQGLIYAQALVPQDKTVRRLLVRQMIADSKLAEAGKLYESIAFDPHAGKAREQRLKVLAALRSGKAQEALAALDALAKKEEKES